MTIKSSFFLFAIDEIAIALLERIKTRIELGSGLLTFQDLNIPW
jgi:hypothetical protein